LQVLYGCGIIMTSEQISIIVASLPLLASVL
jgi:hypothetical protein